MQPGLRKFTAYVYCLICFSLLTVFAVVMLQNKPEVLPGFVFQLASAFGVICGLFYGSNVLEHFAKKEEKRDENNT